MKNKYKGNNVQENDPEGVNKGYETDKAMRALLPGFFEGIDELSFTSMNNEAKGKSSFIMDDNEAFS